MVRPATVVMRALTMAVLAAVFLALVLCTGGCAPLRPDAVTAALVHQSAPFHGPHDPPVGDRSESDESTFNGVQVGTEWERGRLFWDGNVTYTLRERNMEGGPVFVQFRLGIRIRP